VNALGKTEKVLDEGFLDMPQFGLTPQSFTMELIWVAKWIERVLELNNAKPLETYYADRSPFSALLYAPNGHLMRSAISETIEDMLAQADIEIVTVYIKVTNDILWERISERLIEEPQRKQYNEDSREWMETAVKFYDDNSSLWDYTVHNNMVEIDTVISDIKLCIT
jgi:hypothetical protein